MWTVRTKKSSALRRDSPGLADLAGPFAICIAEIHGAVERQVDGSRGISFVDDVTRVVEGDNINDIVCRLERFAAASLRWASNNAVRFETSSSQSSRVQCSMLLSSRGTAEQEWKESARWP